MFKVSNTIRAGCSLWVKQLLLQGWGWLGQMLLDWEEAGAGSRTWRGRKGFWQ